MSQLQQRAFAYTHSKAILAGLEAYASSRKGKEKNIGNTAQQTEKK